MYLCTTRKGIFLDFRQKILDGAFFGLAHRGDEWYAFGHESADIHCPNMRGYILKFTLDGRSERVLTGLDNGVHQIMIHQGELYILETYIQRITIFNLETKLKREVYPLGKAINAWYLKNDLHGDIKNYKHINALSVQDGRFYLMCPNLKNRIGPDGLPVQDKQDSFIAIFDPNWKQIDEIPLGRFFCHDLVILGHEIYFADASNMICKVNTVTRVVEEVAAAGSRSPDHRKICRGLSISKSGEMYVGTHDVDGESFVVNVKTGENIPIESTPCCIMRMDGTDFNDVSSPLRTSLIRVVNDPSLLPTFLELSSVHTHTGTDCNDSLKLLVGETTKNTQIDLNIRRQLPLEDDIFESGSFYMYPKGHGMNWHTNSEQVTNDVGLLSWRMYSIYTSGRSYFLYRHPESGFVHAVQDVNGYCNVFRLPFWHAVLTVTGKRISHGVKFGDEIARRKGFLGGETPRLAKFCTRPPPPYFSTKIESMDELFPMINENVYRFSITEVTEMVHLEHDGSSEWRNDISHGKLVVIVEMSNPEEYEGGTIQLSLGGDQPIEIKERGKLQVTVFPSYTTYRISPVTRGVRKSIMTWVKGPPFI